MCHGAPAAGRGCGCEGSRAALTWRLPATEGLRRSSALLSRSGPLATELHAPFGDALPLNAPPTKMHSSSAEASIPKHLCSGRSRLLQGIALRGEESYLSFRMCSQEAAHIMKKLWSALPRQLDCIDCGAVLSRFQHFGSSRERDATKEARPLARRPGFLRGDAAPANRSRCLRLQQCNWAGAGLGFCVWCGEVMAASRQVNDFWVAPEILQSMKEKEVQPDAWSYSQAMDASNAVQNWEKALEHLGSKLHK